MEALLREMDATRFPNMNIYSFYCLGAQDSQYNLNMTQSDRENLGTMGALLTQNPSLRKKTIGEVLNKESKHCITNGRYSSCFF